MKKCFLLLTMLFVAVANYAGKTANYVEASQEAYSISDPLMLQGYYSSAPGERYELMTVNKVPYNANRITVVVTNPVLSPYNWSVSGSGVSHYISDYHLCEIYFSTGGSRSCTITLSGPLSSTGEQVVKVFAFN